MVISGIEGSFPIELINCLRTAKSCVVLTGAGISVESGVPTFRDPKNGIWATFNLEELATPEGFIKNPKKVWEWYQYRRETIKGIKPNPGHYALVELESYYKDFWLITQNIDGLHALAGSKNILELHGNIHRNKCFNEGTIVKDLPEGDESPPRCPNCHGFLRPDVVWFNELLPEYELSKANEVSSQCDIFISVGTSAIVYPAADLPLIAKRSGAYVIEVNVEETAISACVDVTILGKTGVVLPRLVETCRGNS
ncbi:MAG TPA: SIR2 family NAD-dependent protein deacylase [Candidatus Brocadiia bacterium]|nr:NAD-dependent deacylase [Candidatus Brocadiales bacterium]